MKDLALVEIKPDEFGIEPQKGMQIQESFLPKIAEYKGLQKVYANILEKEINFDTCEEASETRKKLSKVRTGIAAIHKTEKAYYLAAGRFVDAIKNRLTEPITQMEEKLKEIETYYQRQEEERLNKLQSDRMAIIKPFVGEDFERELISLSDEEFNDLVEVKKIAFERRQEEERKEKQYRERLHVIQSYNFPLLVDKLNYETTESEYETLINEAETKKAEIERIKQLKLDREEEVKPYWSYMPETCKSFELYDDMDWECFMLELKGRKKKEDDEKIRIKLENERLKKEKEAAEAKAKEEAKKQAKIEAERIAKEKKEREKLEAKAKEEEVKRLKLEAELEEKIKAEAEAKKKAEEEEKAKKEAERLEALAPEKEKIQKWIDSFCHGSINVFELSKGGETIVNVILSRFEAFKNWAKTQKESIK